MSVRPTSRQYLRCIPPHGISPHGRLNADRKSANRTRCVSKSHSGACAAVHSRPASEEAYGRRPFRIGTMATADRKIQTGLRDNRPSVRKRKDREHHPAAQINKLLINNE